MLSWFYVSRRGRRRALLWRGAGGNSIKRRASSPPTGEKQSKEGAVYIDLVEQGMGKLGPLRKVKNKGKNGN